MRDSSNEDGSLRLHEPLLEAVQDVEEETRSNDLTVETERISSVPSALLLASCTLAVVLFGVTLVVFVALLPAWIFLIMIHHSSYFDTENVLFILAITSTVMLLTALHWRALWVSARYLRVMRTLVLLIRILCLPLVPLVARIESIRELESTQYYKVEMGSEEASPPRFRKSVRRHYRRMQRIYEQQGVRHVCTRAEESLVLRDIIPIIWEHQQRTTQSQTPVEDFVKRALVVVVVPDGILDSYYLGSELVAVQFSILQGKVWHWFMYFCKNQASQSGIWWHGALLAIHRAHVATSNGGNGISLSSCIDWVNAQTHQMESKVHAGYLATAKEDNSHDNILAQLYPWLGRDKYQKR